LEKIECEFNEKMKLIICRRCELAIAAEFISVHMNGKHAIRCSEELVESIVRKYQPLGLEAIIQFKNTTEELESRVDGIPIKRGYRCLVCRYCTHLWDSMTAHFRKEHKGESAKEWTEKDVEMQLLFGGRLKKWFSVKEPGNSAVEEENTDAWTAVESLLAEEKRKAAKGLKEKEENVRLINGFIVRTRWDESIEGEDKKGLISLAAAAGEQDGLKGVMEPCQSHFGAISDRLRGGDVLLRRKIMSEG
jgi:Orsellinic acid/F9775 biosynthesis cluster protein D